MCLLGSRFLPTAKVAELYEQWLEASAEVQALQAERNAVAKQMKGKLEDSVRQELIAKGSDIKKQLATLEASLGALQAQLDVEGRKIPNMTHPAVPPRLLAAPVQRPVARTRHCSSRAPRAQPFRFSAGA